MIQGIAPGPGLFSDHPEVVWGLIASMIVGNVILAVLYLPLIKVWLALLGVPGEWFAALIVVLAVALGRARMLTQSRRERVTAPN